MRTQLPIGGVRFVAVSATIPNVRDIAEWLGADPSAGGLHVFGEEYRPVRLVTRVRGYAMTKVCFTTPTSATLPPFSLLPTRRPTCPAVTKSL